MPQSISRIAMINVFASPSARPPVDAGLEQFVCGDLTAFEAIFREYQGQVYGWIMRLIRDPSAAEDLTLETFWRIWKARARFDPSGNFHGWARRIATNLAIDHLKQ